MKKKYFCKILLIVSFITNAQCPPQYGLPTTACTPTTTNTGFFGTGIVNFVFNTINNTHNDFWNDGTQNFVCTNFTTVNAGSTYTFTATLYGTLGDGNDEYCRIYIDYNNDGAFSAGEIVYNNMTTRQMVHTGNITISTSSIQTNQMLRMRVMTDYDTFDSGCSNPQYGEVEDYGVVINNVAPTDIALSASSINENVAANSTVGTLSSTDVDTSLFTYSLVAGTGDADNASFAISGSDLRITASPDFETKASYAVRVRTFDGTSTFEKAFTISINDVNEAPTDIALSASAINENVAANSTVGTLSSTDVDTSSFTYSLVAGTGDTDNASFTISGSDLRITASPDFETKASYAVRVRTFDGTSTFEKAFTISINDVNEAPTDIALSASSINENVAANSTIGNLSSPDADAANTFTYTLVAGPGDTDNASFNISGNSLRITNSPDFETQSSYFIRVRTTDQSGLFFEKMFTITINDVCELSNTVTQSSGVLTATQTGASYQWYRCPSTLLTGETNQMFTPSVVGDYKVDITVSGCTVTSNCVTVSVLGNTDFEFTNKFKIFPNPATNNVIIQFDDLNNAKLEVIDITGKVLINQILDSNTTTINIEKLPAGMYLFKVSSNKGISTSKVIKN